MPFLDKAIILKILKTYPGADQIEAKYNSLIRGQKENPASFLELVKEKLKEGSSRFISTSSGWFGFNTPQDSEACYLEIRALLDDATKNNKIEAWVDMICAAGEGGFQRYIKSPIKSRFCQTSFMLLMWIRANVAEKIMSIKDRESITDPEELLALKVRQSIEERIQSSKEFIDHCISAIKLGARLKLSGVYSNTLEINVTEMKNHTDSSKVAIDIAHRHLLYLGDDSLKKDIYTKSPQDLFDGLPFYSVQIQKRYNLTEKQIKNIKLHLPLYLQEIYPSLYIRDHRKDLFHVQDEEKVIKSFEALEKIITQENKVLEQKSVSKKVTPSSTPVIPDRSERIRLKTPPHRDFDMTLPLDNEFAFSDLSDEKFGGFIFTSSHDAKDNKADEPQADSLKEAVAAEAALPSAGLMLEPQDPLKVGSPVVEHKSKESERKKSAPVSEVAAALPSEKGLFQPKPGGMHKGKASGRKHSHPLSENKPAPR